MSWKDSPSWFKGGVVAAVIVLILDLLLGALFVFAQNTKNITLGVPVGFSIAFLNFFGFFIAVIFSVISGGEFLLGIGSNLSNTSTIIISLIFSLLFWFAIGSLIGHIKNKRNNS